VAHVITLTERSGDGDGYRTDLPLDQDLQQPIVIDARRLGVCHPMFVVRLRLFFDWHRSQGSTVQLLAPTTVSIAQHLSDMGVRDSLHAEDDVLPPQQDSPDLLAVRRLETFHDVEDAAFEAMQVLHRQSPHLAAWGDAMLTAVGELCDNAIQHGDRAFAYVAADRVEDDARCFRLAIADLGIGIPEHIRSQHPEWQNDTAAIGSVLQRGVTGTGDPHRGNGFAEVLEKASQDHLVQASSAATLDIRAASGRVTVEVVAGVVKPEGWTPKVSRRGTWITYTVTTV
jgi:hypothetical protein